jgi:hypothetical protein
MKTLNTIGKDSRRWREEVVDSSCYGRKWRDNSITLYYEQKLSFTIMLKCWDDGILTEVLSHTFVG